MNHPEERYDFVADDSTEADDTLVTENELAALKSEAAVRELTSVEMAEQLLEEHLPFAILSVAKIASSEIVQPRIRLDAAKYLIDRVLGRITDKSKDAVPMELEEFLNAIVVETGADSG